MGLRNLTAQLAGSLPTSQCLSPPPPPPPLTWCLAGEEALLFNRPSLVHPSSSSSVSCFVSPLDISICFTLLLLCPVSQVGPVMTDVPRPPSYRPYSSLLLFLTQRITCHNGRKGVLYRMQTMVGGGGVGVRMSNLASSESVHFGGGGGGL